MAGKEKLYFLLNRIDDIREITPKGQPLKIHATHNLNNKYRDDELDLLFTKLENDEKVLKVLKTGNRIKEAESRYGLNDYDDGHYHIKLLPSFDEYFFKIQHESEYHEFTSKKPTRKQTYETMGRKENSDKSGKNKEKQIECCGLFYSFLTNQLVYTGGEKHISPETREMKFFLALYWKKGQTVDYKTIAREANLQSYKDLSENGKIAHEDLLDKDFSEDATLLRRDFREIVRSLGMSSEKFLKMIKTIKKKGYQLVCQ